MILRADHYVTLQMMHEMAVTYLYCENEKPTKSKYLEYCRHSLREFGQEFCGFSENGYSDYEEKIIFEALDFLYKHFKDRCNGTIEIYFYRESKNYTIVCTKNGYKKAPN